MSVMTSAPTDHCAPVEQLELLTRPSLSVDSPQAGETRKRRLREPECAFPDPQDSQLEMVEILPFEPCNQEEFTDTEIVAFHEREIEKALESLSDGRSSPRIRNRVIDWVCVPIVHRRHLTDLLSFQAMCWAVGYDAEFLQEYIVRRFAPERLSALGLSR